MIFPRPGLGLGQVAGPYVTYGLGASVEIEVVIGDGLPPGVHAALQVGSWDHAGQAGDLDRHAPMVQLLVGLHTWSSPPPWKHRLLDVHTDHHLQPLLSHVRHWRSVAAEGGVHFRAPPPRPRHGNPTRTNQGHHR